MEVKFNKSSLKLRENMERLQVGEIVMPQIKKIETKGYEGNSEIDFNFDTRYLKVDDVFVEKKHLTCQCSPNFFGTIMTDKLCIYPKIVREYFKTNKLSEKFDNKEECRAYLNKILENNVIQILQQLKPIFSKKELTDKDKVYSLRNHEHLDFLDFSKCEENFKEKNKKFFELCEDEDSIIYYVEKNTEDYSYDLLCAVKDNIPLFVPVPVVKTIAKIENEDNLLIDVKNSKSELAKSNFIHCNQSEEFLNKFKTFFELKSL